MFDILIVGCGPAGVSAAIYAKRAGKKVALVEKIAVGGQVGEIAEIENYPSFSRIDGFSLAQKFNEHLKDIGVEIISDEIINFDLKGEQKKLVGRKKTYLSKAVILAMGSHPRQLKIEGEERLKGRGVSYCAVCDGNFFKNKDVVVVGSGSAAYADAKYLSGICKSITLLTKNSPRLVSFSDLEKTGKVKVKKDALCTAVDGKDIVESVTYVQNGKEKTILASALFIAIGRQPETDSLQGQIDLDDRGYIKVNQSMQTSMAGVYACGDVRDGSLKQIVTAEGDGAIAATSAIQFLQAKNI